MAQSLVYADGQGLGVPTGRLPLKTQDGLTGAGTPADLNQMTS